jgi:hypothetical protein
MLHVAAILFGAAFTVAVSCALGKMLLRALKLEFFRAEEHVFAFLCGAACLSTLVFALAMLRLIRPGIVLSFGLAVLAAAVWRGAHRPRGKPFAPLPRFWKVVFVAVFAIFGAMYLFCAMAPETSPDGAQYHLGLVARYFKAHGFYRITTDMYASLSEGAEMLYLFAFAFGRHSSASMVHLAFLLALPLAMLFYGRRFGFPGAGAAGALLVFASPIIGWDGTTAYIDVAAAAAAFAAFYLLQIWDREGTRALLVPIGLVAGFCYAIKYTAGVAVPYVLAVAAWKLRRKREPMLGPLALLAASTAVMVLPWMLKNWIWAGNPLAPFFNSLFPNPYIHISFEREYRYFMAHWGDLKNYWEIPVEVTLHGGRLQGILGPAFLLFPLALLALRFREGRALVLAALVFAIPYRSNILTRFLIPMAPFLALALAMAMKNWKGAAPAVVMLQVIASWPDVLSLYSNSLRIERIPVAAALRIQPEEDYLRQRMYEYPASRMLDERVPDTSKIFAIDQPPAAYNTRQILVGYQAALNNNLLDQLRVPLLGYTQPTRRLTFHFPRQRLLGLRVLQSASKPNQEWSVNELRILDGGRELPRAAGWQIAAKPNPWEAGMAFDNNPVTRWKSWQPMQPGMYLEVRFASPQFADSVVLLVASDQDGSELSLRGTLEEKSERLLAKAPEAAVFDPPWQFRRLAVMEVKFAGIDYILVRDNSDVGKDMLACSALWGVRPVESRQGLTLYRIEDGPDLATNVPEGTP